MGPGFQKPPDDETVTASNRGSLMEAWQFLLFCSERYKSLDTHVKGKVNGHPPQEGPVVSTLDIPIRLLSSALAEKQKGKCARLRVKR